MVDPADSRQREQAVIGVVGPCSAGKSLLVKRLRAAGYRVREIRQEHSVSPRMWQLFVNPDLLIYLDVTMEMAARREGLSHASSWWPEEREVRLAHARRQCDYYVDTTNLTVDEVATRVLGFLRAKLG